MFGLPATLDLDAQALERRYVELSRAAHPDHQQRADAAAQAAALQRAAAVNDAHRVLRDRWKRAEALIERTAPGLLERSKQLATAFLADALELAEEVAAATPATAPDLRSRLEAEVELRFAALRDALAHGDAERAATGFHEARYFRKALADLRDGGGDGG